MISITTLKGTDGVSQSRITINDNFNTIVSRVNDISSIIDTSTGRINNSNYGGSLDDIRTTRLEVTSNNVVVQQGHVSVSLGDLKLEGQSSKVRFRNSSYFDHQLVGATSTDFNTISFLGNGNNHGLVLPRVTPSELSSMADSSDIEEGTVAYRLGGTGGTGPVFFDGDQWRDITFS